ncbi:MAG: transglutaminase family protein [Gammaproteobacteria bacterium]|nr:transglutaminase family protein [Gammaproteobacteria bacterium]
MSIKIAIDHQTEYSYEQPVFFSPHVLRLRPAPHSRTPILHYALDIYPKKHFINWQQDPFGNWLARLVFEEKSRQLRIKVSVVAEMTIIDPFDFFVEESADKYPFAYEPQLKKDLVPYLEVRESGPRLLQLFKAVDRTPPHIVDFLVVLNQSLRHEVNYTIRLEPGIQSCEETLKKQSGSCRDSAWLLVQLLRHLGLAARFVSGYLVQLTADLKALDGPDGPATDFTDLHAWTEVYIPGAGWIGLDPTSGLFAGEGHIPLACTPDPTSAAPVTGGYLGKECKSEFTYHNRIERIHEDPRVTLPYSDAQWAAINALGEAVDHRLEEREVRLTMGGEPTFVSIDDMDSPQWNTAALGADKETKARTLLLRLKRQFAPGAVRHYGQGKWYPGEPLPRWAYGCFWRRDGKPIWKDDKLIADGEKSYGATAEDAKAFITVLTQKLGITAHHIYPCFEDVFYYLWREGQLPDNVDPFDNRLDNPLERARLRRLFETGLDQEVGFALPITWNEKEQRWQSGEWQLRRKRLYLLPGDSPIGYRLPLESLLWEKENDRLQPQAQDLFEPRSELGDSVGEVARLYDHIEQHNDLRQGFCDQNDPSRPDRDKGKVVRTALCIEPRGGRLHLFLPPLTHLEHFLELIATIEATAAECNLPLLLEGYEPPHDPRLRRLSVTPDPGVIEVNIHPAASWSELSATTLTLYQEARLSRLGTEKFLVDGRHSGTGGGNHVTLGGATPSDSPMLRRPDLLRSLITYWQHHPGLSYLFSGLFIGSTSQAPRVDEGRDEALYELEIAFSKIPQGEVPEPWLVDRLLRNLLIDVTGNTHRAEFCIDKLYSPDSASGRLGILELRAFEMPPHPRMALVQYLLLRALVARFWDNPYHKPLVRWGTELHDRWLLPHYVRRDLEAVTADLRSHGIDFAQEWLEPFYEFRFPHYGTLHSHDITLELRQAIEPWNVLGEEVTGGGTARFVDSSVERLEVHLSGLTDNRHILTCNGRRVPLRPTGSHGDYVSGIRFRAWHPPSALHPTIGIHAPLRFELVDSWNDRIVAACSYHVVHPGGRSSDSAPVNAFAAESRRIARFWSMGYGNAGEKTTIPPLTAADSNPEYPYTLDLRRG